MKNKKHLIISIIVHIVVIVLILFVPTCARKENIDIVENVKIVQEVPSIEVKEEVLPPKPEPPKPEPPKIEPKPEPKPEPKLVKKKKVVKKYTPDDLKKRLEEKLKEEPEPQPEQKTAPAQKPSTNIRSAIKENWYLTLLKSKIENSWQQPSRVLLTGKDALKLTVSFTLKTSGSVSNIKILKSSGIALVDISAMNAVKNAAPFSPIPEGTSDKPIDISIDFILKE